MKRFLKHILVLLISMSAICFVDYICPQDISAAEATINWVRGVPYDANGYRIIMSGNEIQLVATTAKSDIWVSGGWNSNNKNVASVTQSKMYTCIVKGGHSGTCTISYDGSTMYYLPDALTGKLLPMVNKQHEEFRIRVVGVDTISLNKTSLSVKLNGSEKLSYTLSPADDYTTALTTVTYSSSDTSVATVDADGNVKGIKAGTATITAKTGDGKMATCQVTVPSSSSSKTTTSSGSTSKTASGKVPSKVKLNKTKLSLKKGASKKLKYSFTPNDAKSTVTWTSSNKKVAKVSASGKVTATGYGSTVITVKTSNGKTATCKVTVPAPKVKKIKLNKTKLKLVVGKKATLKYTISPKGAKTKVSFKSSKISVATVNSKGRILAKKAGKTTITVKTSNGKKATCKVTVKTPAIKKIKLSKSSLNLEVGDKYQMAYTLSPKNASGAIKWKSSKTSVATVNSKGLITAKKAGTAKITAYKGKIKAVCTVTVKKKASEGNSSQENAANTGSSASNVSTNAGNTNETVTKNVPATAVEISGSATYMRVGESMNLNAVVSPSTTTDAVSWTSSNSSVASVSANGVVKGLRTGGVTITAKAGSKIASVQIAVVSGDVYDISKGQLLILGDNTTNDSIIYCGDTYAYNESTGVTIVQSDPAKSNFIRIGGGKVTFANVHMSGCLVQAVDYERNADGTYRGDIVIEFMEGTENSFSYGNAPIKFLQSSTSTNRLIIQGTGKVDLYSGYGPAIMGSNITIKDITMTARVVTETCAVIGTYNDTDCSNITIESGANITAYGGYRAVGAGQGGTETNISIASGTVRHVK